MEEVGKFLQSLRARLLIKAFRTYDQIPSVLRTLVRGQHKQRNRTAFVNKAVPKLSQFSYQCLLIHRNIPC